VFDGLFIDNEGSSLTDGSLVRLQSNAIEPQTGIFSTQANKVASGKIISIEANALSSGSALQVHTKDSTYPRAP
jgi:hypothetical protein